MNAQNMHTGLKIRQDCPCKASSTCPPRQSHSALLQHKLPMVQRKAQVPQARASVVARAAETETAAASTSKGSNGAGGGDAEEFYEVFITKPLGIRFGRGNKDGGAYVTSVDKANGNIDERIEVGDKVVEVSASFGEDVWEAGNFGQCMYAIKTRNGDLYFKFKKMYGDMSAFEQIEESEAEAQFRRERAGGNYGGGTKELQLMNFKKRQEEDARRKGLFETGLKKFNKKDVEGALYDFEEVIAMERKPPVKAKDYLTVSSLYRVAHYNVACCYAAIDQIEAGLEALDICMRAGFDQFGKVRSDPNLEKLRQSPKFKPLIEKFDEPVIDTDLFKGFKSFFGKKD